MWAASPTFCLSKAVHSHPNPVCKVGTVLMPALALQCSIDMEMIPGDLSSMPGSQEELRELVRTCSPGFLFLSSFPCFPPILFALSLHLPQPLTSSLYEYSGQDLVSSLEQKIGLCYPGLLVPRRLKNFALTVIWGLWSEELCPL